MNINVLCCMFVLDNQINENIRKNDIKKIKVLVNKQELELPQIIFDGTCNIKDFIRNHIKSIINSDIFHLEQVYTLGDEKFLKDNKLDVIYIGITNINNINKLDSKYKLVDFSIKDNNSIILGDNCFKYNTSEMNSNNNIEYIHNINAEDLSIEKKILELLIAFKYLRNRIDNTDIIFKFMPEIFSLEDIRIVYEIIKDTNVDKSNFRKKIAKYCEKVEDRIDKKGHRPTQLYRFKPLSNDVWL